MTDTLPDRLSTDPASPYFNEELLQRGVGLTALQRCVRCVDAVAGLLRLRLLVDW